MGSLIKRPLCGLSRRVRSLAKSSARASAHPAERFLFYRKCAIFYRVKKMHLHKLIPALFLSLSFLFLSGTTPRDSVFSAGCELIILWEDALSEEEASLRLSSLCSELVLTEHIDNFSLCQSSSPEQLSSQLKLLNTDSRIRIAEPNSDTVLCSAMDDTEFFHTQWALHNTGNYLYYIQDIPIHRTAVPDVDINLPEAYELLASQQTSRPVTVAVIDTGVDVSHPALTDHIWNNENEIPNNGIDDDNNGYIDDTFGWDFYHNDNTVCHYEVSALGRISADPKDNDNHGTHCAGIIAASQGVYGVAAGIDVRILPLKIHGGEKNSGSVADAVKAIKYAETAGADICNMSWGTPVYSEALETVMRESHMLFVVAAGNSGDNNNSSPLYPASYALDNMISVAYVTQSGELATDSNYGISTVDIAAPGQDIYSTTVGGNYHYLSGTSMAAPVVSGICALLYAHGDAPYPQNIKEIILQTLKPLPALTGYVRYAGIPDAAQVVAAVDSLVNDTTAPTLRAETQYNENDLLVLLHPEDLGGSGVRTMRYATGDLDSAYFARGTVGQSITDSVVSFHKAGTYTFYISDYAGNENTLVYSVLDDNNPPVLSASYKENPDGTYTVSVSATDTASGIKRLRYTKGTPPDEFFLAAGQNLPLGNHCSFIAEADNTYTLYATDYRGNKTVYVIEVKRTPAERLFLNTLERTLHTGEQFRLVPLLLPLAATDYISYEVSDETLLYAATDGTLTALAPGTVTVTVRTSGGLSKECTIHIE